MPVFACLLASFSFSQHVLLVLTILRHALGRFFRREPNEQLRREECGVAGPMPALTCLTHRKIVTRNTASGSYSSFHLLPMLGATEADSTRIVKLQPIIGITGASIINNV